MPKPVYAILTTVCANFSNLRHKKAGQTCPAFKVGEECYLIIPYSFFFDFLLLLSSC
jgi:hypothetical protein